MPGRIRLVGAGIGALGVLAVAIDWVVRRRHRPGGPDVAGGGPGPAGDREPRAPLPTAGSTASALDLPPPG